MAWTDDEKLRQIIEVMEAETRRTGTCPTCRLQYEYGTCANRGGQ